MDNAVLTALCVPAVVLINQCFTTFANRRKAKLENEAEVLRVAALERQRRWDREDRDEKAVRALHAASVHTGQVLAAVEENTQISARAFDTANDYNAKIAVNSGEIALLHARMARIEATVLEIREAIGK